MYSARFDNGLMSGMCLFTKPYALKMFSARPNWNTQTSLKAKFRNSSKCKGVTGNWSCNLLKHKTRK